MSKEAMKLALEALEMYLNMKTMDESYLLEIDLAPKAITAIREALVDSALDRMAENARELGLDYEPPCKTGSQCTSKCQQCEQPAQQEPVAWESLLGAVARGWCYEENANKTMDSDLAVAIAKEVQALYTTPQQRTWVGLTDDEAGEIYYRFDGMELMRAIEAKLKEKNT